MATTITGVLTTVLGVLLYSTSRDFPSGASAASDPGLLPGAVGLALVLCGVGLVISVIVRRVARTSSDATAPDVTRTAGPFGGDDQTSPILPFAFLAMVGLVGWAALRLGFLTFTGLLLIGSALLLEQERHTPWSIARSILVGALITVAIYVIFTSGLQVRFPGTLLP